VALAVRKGVLTSPGATGSQVTNLTTGGSWPASTQVMALIVWTSYATAAGVSGISAQWCHGFGTEDGGSVQQAFANYNSLDASLNGAPSGSCNTTSILRGLVPGTSGTGADFIATLTDLNTDAFTLNWTDLPATASIKVHYLALGGADIAQARAFSFTGNNAATQDVTVVAGFGQPDVVLIAGGGGTGLTDGSSGAWNIGLGAGFLDGSARCSWLWEEDAVATMNVFGRQIAEMIVARGIATAGSGILDQADMSASSHPTDGFELSWSNTSANSFVGLAIRGDLQVAMGTLDSSTSGSGTDSIDAGFTPAAALFWGLNMPTSAVDISADNTALLGAFGIGAYDGTNEGYSAFAIDDAAIDQQSGQSHSETKAVQSIDPGATPTLQGEADASFSGTSVVLTWTDADNVSRESNVLVFGSAPGGAPTTSLPFLPYRQSSNVFSR
jgi:hypothetical protein